MGNLFSDNIPVYIEPTQQTTRYQHLSFLTRPFQIEKVNDVGGGEGEGDGEDVGVVVGALQPPEVGAAYQNLRPDAN